MTQLFRCNKNVYALHCDLYPTLSASHKALCLTTVVHVSGSNEGYAGGPTRLPGSVWKGNTLHGGKPVVIDHKGRFARPPFRDIRARYQLAFLLSNTTFSA